MPKTFSERITNDTLKKKANLNGVGRIQQSTVRRETRKTKLSQSNGY